MEQFFEHSDLGLGTLTFQKGPGTIHCWTGRIADTEILFSIILNTSELRSANLDFIRSVLQNWREYLSKAEHEIQAQIGKSPEKFGLQRAPFPETEIPAEQPQFLFYDETEWGLHFEICTLPVGEPFGLMVEFSGDTPTDVYGLSEAEEIEATWNNIKEPIRLCENAKILCPYCLTREIDPAQAICSACYSKEDKWERGSWDDLRKRKNADEIQMFTIAKKVDEAFQIPENEAYACIEKHEMIQAEALEREMEAFHRRRILCMVEIFSKIDCGILFSGYVELDTYFKNVWDYAHQRIAAEQLREVQEYLRSQIPWKSLSSQRMDLGAELLNFWCGEDELDWGYSQYFEIAAGNLKPFLAMTLFTEILCKHFPDVMSAPVKRLSSKL